MYYIVYVLLLEFCLWVCILGGGDGLRLSTVCDRYIVSYSLLSQTVGRAPARNSVIQEVGELDDDMLMHVTGCLVGLLYIISQQAGLS